jgi:hyperosmotically inducible protein
MYHRFLFPLNVLLLTLALLGCSGVLSAQQTPKRPADTEGVKPDNTKANKRDRQNNSATADQANNTASDRKLMQQIRQAVMDDKSLSTYAHNVKIIAQNGKVTLKGPVHTMEEKQAIASKAHAVAGGENVINEITVKGDKGSRKKQSDKKE